MNKWDGTTGMLLEGCNYSTYLTHDGRNAHSIWQINMIAFYFIVIKLLIISGNGSCCPEDEDDDNDVDALNCEISVNRPSEEFCRYIFKHVDGTEMAKLIVSPTTAYKPITFFHLLR